MNREERLRFEIGKCRNCEACRLLVDLSCLVFPRMFHLVDEETASGKRIPVSELVHLVSLCTFCAACPCLDIRAAIMEAKTEFAERYGLPLRTRIIERVERIGKLESAFPKTAGFFLRKKPARRLLGKAVGIHPERRIPEPPEESFPAWLGRHRKGARFRSRRKVAYFAGCNARYFFPEVAKATLHVLERNGVEVYYPEQRCCGMPSLLEGDRKLTLALARFNVSHLAEAVEKGYDIVCSCPTCGYMLKKILRVGADRSPECREEVPLKNGFVKIPVGRGATVPPRGAFMMVREKLIGVMLKDEGYFSEISPGKRILVARNTYDLGEYLMMLAGKGVLDLRLEAVHARAVYYPPCHLREQRIGLPYASLLDLIPGTSVSTVEGNFCCGNGGIMGFKQEFFSSSIRIASRLIARIKAMDPEVIVTDCLSCRMQFTQVMPYRVVHPIQMIEESYGDPLQ